MNVIRLEYGLYQVSKRTSVKADEVKARIINMLVPIQAKRVFVLYTARSAQEAW
jgi:hypothetical protein